jgi:two-component system NarL family sensor kinase
MTSASADEALPLAQSAQGTPAIFAALTPSAAAIRLDTQGRISDATISAAAMLGFEPQELRGRTLKDLALEGWQAAAEVAAARVRFGATESFELALRGRSGRRTLVEMTARAGAGGAEGAVVAWSERRMRRGAAAQDADQDLKRVAYGLLRTQEAERMRVALELHDEVAPIVIMVKYMIEDAVGKFGSEAAADSVHILNDAALRLRDVIADLRRISTDLRPKLLDDLGLVPTLEWYCRGVEEAREGMRVECRVTLAESDVPQELKLDIFRIVQTAVNNVVEHAHAQHAQVSLFVGGDELVVVVEDDGNGFDFAGAMSRGDADTVGLQSIRKRAEATGGRLILESNGARGTRIGAAWRLPLAPQRSAGG